jgi:small-conductance mechanosensitive channel
VGELGQELFERYIEVEAARVWGEILAGRVGTAGLTAEAGVYQDELAALNALGGANARRVHALTGNAAPEPGKLGTGEQTKLPALSGEIGKTRGELTVVRTRGAQRLGIKIAAILLAAFLLPRFVMYLLRRALGRDEAGNSSMVLTAVGAFLKAIVWVAALAMILSVLGFDVTAIIAGLGIGGLAIGLAAQPMISDVIGAVIIFAERRFRIGDVVKLGADEPARVVGLTWRSTALKNADGLVVSVPNRKVTETTIQNLTKSGHTYDWLSATVTTDKDVNKVLEVIRKAMELCANLSPDHGVSVKKFTHKGTTQVVEYRFWWFLKDYESRNKTRDEVFSRIGAELAHEGMAGTEVTLA